MIQEIKIEIRYVFWLFILISWGLMFCDIGNRQALWQEKYDTWEYKTNPQESKGFSRAIIYHDISVPLNLMRKGE